MIKKILYTAAAALMLTGCDDTWNAKLDKEGQLSLSGMGLDVVTTETIGSRAGEDVSNFIVTIKQGDEQINQWVYSKMPEIVTLPVGSYTVEAYSHVVAKQGWDCPTISAAKTSRLRRTPSPPLAMSSAILRA